MVVTRANKRKREGRGVDRNNPIDFAGGTDADGDAEKDKNKGTKRLTQYVQHYGATTGEVKKFVDGLVKAVSMARTIRVLSSTAKALTRQLIQAKGLLVIMECLTRGRGASQRAAGGHFQVYCVDFEAKVQGSMGLGLGRVRERQLFVQDNLATDAKCGDVSSFPQPETRDGIPVFQVESECGALACIYTQWFLSPLRTRYHDARERVAGQMAVWRLERTRVATEARRQQDTQATRKKRRRH
jgi:hypothetical protein